MESKRIAMILGELGNETRLAIFRLLVRHAREGLVVGEIQEALGIPLSTLAFHLRGLAQAGLIEQEKEGRAVRNRPVIEVLRSALRFLDDECCAGS